MATSVDGLAECYRAELPDVQTNMTAFVDKMPANFRYLGYIAAAFPDAVIINIDRDPRDVALSMWRTYFSAGGMAYTSDQRCMAAEANRYRRFMNHWAIQLGVDRIYSVKYETFVSNFPIQSQKLASACHLDWNQAMATPETNAAAVKTASQHQVRRAVNTGSVGTWEHFKPELEVFCTHLDPTLWSHYL